MEIRVSVRNFVEFLMREGSIDNRRVSGSEDAMQEGSRIHRMIQRRMGAEYKAEVSLAHEIDCGQYTVRIEGRADGIIEGNPVVVDEIKATYRELKKLTKPVAVHLAQAKCYAYFYWCLLRKKQQIKNEEIQKEKQLPSNIEETVKTIGVRMTYCNIDTEEIKYFHENFTFHELENWFHDLFAEYKKWADFTYEWRQIRTKSAKEVPFPFPYREGQKELVTYVYQTICHKKKLFLQAPTGVGKTISTIYPGIKAVGEGKADKIFYLTAKTITRTVAVDALDILREKGLFYKSVIITAKDKICFLEEANCNPEACPYANGHFDRINEAIYDLLTHEDSFTRETIEQYALNYQVCPFELGLDMSLFSDAIICDYNYLFDPYVYLKRFFTEGIKGDYLFFIDEAHNLVDRGREMYSASLIKERFLELKKVVKLYDTKMEKQLEKCNKELLALKKQCEDMEIVEYFGSFVMALNRLHGTMSTYLEDHDDSPIRKEILEFYFEISRFLQVNEKLDDDYVTYTQMLENGEFMIKEFCVNPARQLKECMDRGISSTLFSATFLPIQYYKGLLGGDESDYEVYAQSTFDNRKRKLLIGNQVTSKYTRRSEMEYYNIANYIYELTKEQTGNYMVFFPSHAFLENVYEAYEQYFLKPEKVECLLQRDYMSEEEREAFLNRFYENRITKTNVIESEKQEIQEEIAQICSDWIFMEIEMEEENADNERAVKINEREAKTILGFCVLGGIFSEGIDLKNDSLIGAIIVGTGLPQVCHEREILKEYFENQGKNGFEYAYAFPGMNKVQQAAGRVIRTADDIGIVALLDDRFLQRQNRKLFPREWEQFQVVSINECGKEVKEFFHQMEAERNRAISSL